MYNFCALMFTCFEPVKYMRSLTVWTNTLLFDYFSGMDGGFGGGSGGGKRAQYW